MATIKDVARLAGVSVTTVSIVLNGKAQERKIPLKTCARIEGAMSALGYRPNLSARRLRTNEQHHPVVALYWPLDYRVNILAHLLNAMQGELKRRRFACEFIIQTYESDNLIHDAEPILKSDYNAVIMGGLSSKDIAFLESVPLQIPVVLINRTVEKFSTVGVNNTALAEKAVALFLHKGYRRVGAICSRDLYFATNQRTQSFLESCKRSGIEVPEEWILRTENKVDGGLRAAQRFLAFAERPRAIFCDSDAIAFGLVSYFNRHGLRVPEDLEILSIASMIDNAYTAHCTPSISTIALPHDRIATAAISLTIDALEFGSAKAQHIEIEPDLFLRESFSLD